MATLIMSNYGRCDLTCHGAKHAKCVCICGGRYHGAARREGGVEQAVQDFGAQVLTSLGIAVAVPELTQAMLLRARGGSNKPVRLKIKRNTLGVNEASAFPHQGTFGF